MNPKMTILRKKAMALPLLPGVYIMHGADGGIIYIGKAKALKSTAPTAALSISARQRRSKTASANTSARRTIIPKRCAKW